jgi:hypothetical protein
MFVPVVVMVELKHRMQNTNIFLKIFNKNEFDIILIGIFNGCMEFKRN